MDWCVKKNLDWKSVDRFSHPHLIEKIDFLFYKFGHWREEIVSNVIEERVKLTELQKNLLGLGMPVLCFEDDKNKSYKKFCAYFHRRTLRCWCCWCSWCYILYWMSWRNSWACASYFHCALHYDCWNSRWSWPWTLPKQNQEMNAIVNKIT